MTEYLLVKKGISLLILSYLDSLTWKLWDTFDKSIKENGMFKEFWKKKWEKTEKIEREANVSEGRFEKEEIWRVENVIEKEEG